MAGSGTLGALQGFGKGMADVGLIMMEDNLETHRQTKLQELKNDRSDFEYGRKKTDDVGIAEQAQADKLEQIDRAGKYKDKSKDGSLSDSDRTKGLNKELAEIDKQIEDARVNDVPWDEEKIKTAKALARERWAKQSTTSLDEDRIAEIQAKIKARQGKGESAPASKETPAPKGLIEKPPGSRIQKVVSKQNAKTKKAREEALKKAGTEFNQYKSQAYKFIQAGDFSGVTKWMKTLSLTDLGSGDVHPLETFIRKNSPPSRYRNPRSKK